MALQEHVQENSSEVVGDYFSAGKVQAMLAEASRLPFMCCEWQSCMFAALCSRETADVC